MLVQRTITHAHAAGHVALIFVISLYLPQLACSDSSTAHVQASAFAAPPRSVWSGVTTASRSTSCYSLRGKPATAVCGLHMQEDEREARIFGSRRLAEWAVGLGNEGEKLLWSRRLARKVHAAFTTRGRERKMLEGQDVAGTSLDLKSNSTKANKEQWGITEPLNLEIETEQQGVEHLERVVVTAQVQEDKQELMGAVGSSRDKQEWGAIMAVSCSPSRPELPKLTAEEEQVLLSGERVQKQIRNGRVGTGMVVVDVQADISTVFAVLTDLERYPERISTVRRCTIYERGTKICKAQFALSRFMLEINTELKCERDQNTLRFELDKDRKPLVMEEAKGFWFLEEAPERGQQSWTRVWLMAGITCSSLLPTFLVDYAAARALPRATTWLRPTIEAIASQLPPGADNVRDTHAAKSKAAPAEANKV